MYCTHCGKQIADDAVICVNCGMATKNMQATVPAPMFEGKKLNAFGLAGFVVGLVSIWLGFYFCIVSIVGLALSLVGISKSKNCRSNGFAIAGLVISACSLIFWLIIWVLIILMIILSV